MENNLQRLIQEEVEKALAFLTEGIVHLDKLKPRALLDFLKSWNLDKSKFYIAEKMDGNYMALGVQDHKFYLRSKNKMFMSADEVPNIFFMSDFKKYFELLEGLPWDSLFEDMAKKYNFEYNGTFEIEGEAIPSFDHNIVIYDEAKIGDGLFIIFNSKTSVGKAQDGLQRHPEMWQEIANVLNENGSVKFFTSPTVDLSALEFDNELIIDLEELIKKHGNFLKKPARTPGAKELKNKLLARVAEIGMTAKSQALTHQVVGNFGPEIEGVVITGQDGSLVKIVDRDKFTQRKHDNWHFINQLINAERVFKKGLKSSGPSALANLLDEWLKSVRDTQEDFQENADSHITIQKKRKDTENGIAFALGMVSAMQNRLVDGDDPATVVDAFNSKEIIPEAVFVTALSHILSENLDRDISEGGNVFDEMNSVVPKALLEPSIQQALSFAGLNNLSFEVIGNKSKDYFNDIDIAIDVQELKEYLVLPENADKNDLWLAVDEFLSKSKVAKYSIVKGLSQFHILAPLVDSSGEHMRAFSADGERSDSLAMIQIDIFVGNVAWMTDASSGAPEDSKYKAVWRNKLLNSIVSKIKLPTESGLPVEEEYYRYIIDYKNGVKKRRISIEPPSGRRKKPKRVTLSDEIIITDANELAHLFFGPSIFWKDIDSYERLREMLMSGKFKYKEFLPDILEDIDKSKPTEMTKV